MRISDWSSDVCSSDLFRTGMTLAMFTLVMFSLVVMATLNHNFTQLFLGDDARGGYDVRVVTNENNPIEDLRTALTETGYDVRSEERRVGKECVRTCRSRCVA